MTPEKANSLKPHWEARQLATMALFLALGVVLSFIELSLFPPAPFLKYDASNVPALLTGFSYGPAAGCLVGVLIAWIHSLFTGNFWGALVNTGVVIAYVLPASLIFRASGGLAKRSSSRGKNSPMAPSANNIDAANAGQRGFSGNVALVLGLVVSSLVATAVALLLNILITPIYMGVPREAVIGMMLPILLPFNLLKSVINSVLGLILMKSLHSFIK
ncbi:MAG: ECF transporter S component [Actinomycetia bacterium]|nr:ECF transporter S component [Actinomycetes bacterium]